ncbi:hypothetical protein [Brachyspira intermedia]|uniref:hypothetical protein n=1 Tax=Brachyspira intermedia TaxID=84377 RepID=UPI0030071F69
MIKKVLLIAAFIIFAVSCSKTPTDPNNGNTGDSGIINGGSGTTEPTAISDFLKNHSGRYYVENTDTQYGITTRYIGYRIEDGKIYENVSKNEMNGNKTLSGNKLQIESQGYQSSQYGSDWNPYIEILNFSDNTIQSFYKMIFTKENFATINGYEKITTINGAEKYAGNYYQYTGEAPSITKYYLFTIDDKGNIYSEQKMASQLKCSLNGNILTLEFPQGKYNCLLEANRAIASIFVNNVEQSSIMKKSDLLTPYIGTYSGEGTTLTVNETDAVITSDNLMNPKAILNGSNLIIYEYEYINNTANVKEHKIVFSDDKKTATYTKPDNGGTVTLTIN